MLSGHEYLATINFIDNKAVDEVNEEKYVLNENDDIYFTAYLFGLRSTINTYVSCCSTNIRSSNHIVKIQLIALDVFRILSIFCSFF